MRKNENKGHNSPEKNKNIPWRVTPVMEAPTYSDRLQKEFEEELAAVVLAETFPDRLNYPIPGEEDENEEE